MEIRDEINAKEYEFEYANELGNRLLSKNPKFEHVVSILNNIGNAKKDLEDTWRQKDHDYRQLFEYQVFNREADRIDAITKGHDAFLEINYLGVIKIPCYTLFFFRILLRVLRIWQKLMLILNLN